MEVPSTVISAGRLGQRAVKSGIRALACETGEHVNSNGICVKTNKEDILKIIRKEQEDHHEAVAYIQKKLDKVIQLQSSAVQTLQKYSDRVASPEEGKDLLHAAEHFNHHVVNFIKLVQICNKESLDRAHLLHCVDINKLQLLVNKAMDRVLKSHESLQLHLLKLQSWRRAASYQTYTWLNKTRNILFDLGKFLWRNRSYIAISYMVLSFLSGPSGWLTTVMSQLSGSLVKKAMTMARITLVWLCEYYVPEIAIGAIAYLIVTLFTRHRKPFVQLLRRLKAVIPSTSSLASMLSDLEDETESNEFAEVSSTESGLLTAVSYVSYYYRPAIALLLQEFCKTSTSLLSLVDETPASLSEVSKAVDGLYQYWQTGNFIAAVAKEGTTSKGIEKAVGSALNLDGGDTADGTWSPLLLSSLSGLVICMYTIIWYGRKAQKNKKIQNELVKFQFYEAIKLSHMKPIKREIVTHSTWRRLAREQKSSLSSTELLELLKL